MPCGGAGRNETSGFFMVGSRCGDVSSLWMNPALSPCARTLSISLRDASHSSTLAFLVWWGDLAVLRCGRGQRPVGDHQLSLRGTKETA